MFEIDEQKQKIGITEGDYGKVLPLELEDLDTELTSDDKFSLKIFKEIDGKPIIEQVYENIVDNTIEFKLTKEESALLEIGSYYYDIDWYQENVFLTNIVKKKIFEVSEKAGKVGA